MDYIDLKKLSEMLEPPTANSSDSEDDLPKSSLVQLCKSSKLPNWVIILLPRNMTSYIREQNIIFSCNMK